MEISRIHSIIIKRNYRVLYVIGSIAKLYVTEDLVYCTPVTPETPFANYRKHGSYATTHPEEFGSMLFCIVMYRFMFMLPTMSTALCNLLLFGSEAHFRITVMIAWLRFASDWNTGSPSEHARSTANEWPWPKNNTLLVAVERGEGLRGGLPVMAAKWFFFECNLSPPVTISLCSLQQAILKTLNSF